MKIPIFFTFWTFSWLIPNFCSKCPTIFYFLVPKKWCKLSRNCKKIFPRSLRSLGLCKIQINFIVAIVVQKFIKCFFFSFKSLCEFGGTFFNPGVILEGDLGEKVSLSWLTSPYLELREKWKCIEFIGKIKIWTKTSPWNPEIVAKLLPLWKL